MLREEEDIQQATTANESMSLEQELEEAALSQNEDSQNPEIQLAQENNEEEQESTRKIEETETIKTKSDEQHASPAEDEQGNEAESKLSQPPVIGGVTNPSIHPSMSIDSLAAHEMQSLVQKPVFEDDYTQDQMKEFREEEFKNQTRSLCTFRRIFDACLIAFILGLVLVFQVLSKLDRHWALLVFPLLGYLVTFPIMLYASFKRSFIIMFVLGLVYTIPFFYETFVVLIQFKYMNTQGLTAFSSAIEGALWMTILAMDILLFASGVGFWRSWRKQRQAQQLYHL